MVRAAVRRSSAALLSSPPRSHARTLPGALAAVGRRDADGEARAQHAAVGGAAVAGGDRAAIRLQYLPADRKPPPPMRPETLRGAVGGRTPGKSPQVFPRQCLAPLVAAV